MVNNYLTTLNGKKFEFSRRVARGVREEDSPSDQPK